MMFVKFVILFCLLDNVVSVAAQVAIIQPPPPPPQGIVDQVAVDTLFHPDILQPPSVKGSTLIPPPTS